jgi:SnoaL-like domain
VGAPTAGRLRCSRPSAALAALVLLVGCGGGGSHAESRPVQRHGGERTAPPALHRADPRKVAIVRAWVDALRAGHVARASSYFALPAIVQNASPAYELRTRVQVRAFNASLPCGARFVRAVASPHYTIVTFRLTERRGRTPGCGSATGRLAATAFAFRHGKISEWRRVLVPSKPPPV